MPTTPTGPLSLPMQNLRALVAACTSFQTWTGTADAAAAQDRVHLVGPPLPADPSAGYTKAELETLRPFAIVDVPSRGGGGFDAQRVAVRTFRQSGRLLLTFEDDVEAADAADYAEAKVKFRNEAGAVLAEMLTRAGGDGMLVVRSVTETKMYRASKKERSTVGDFHVIGFLVEWGP